MKNPMSADQRSGHARACSAGAGRTEPRRTDFPVAFVWYMRLVSAAIAMVAVAGCDESSTPNAAGAPAGGVSVGGSGGSRVAGGACPVGDGPFSPAAVPSGDCGSAAACEFTTQVECDDGGFGSRTRWRCECEQTWQCGELERGESICP